RPPRPPLSPYPALFRSKPGAEPIWVPPPAFVRGLVAFFAAQANRRVTKVFTVIRPRQGRLSHRTRRPLSPAQPARRYQVVDVRLGFFTVLHRGAPSRVEGCVGGSSYRHGGSSLRNRFLRRTARWPRKSPGPHRGSRGG